MQLYTSHRCASCSSRIFISSLISFGGRIRCIRNLLLHGHDDPSVIQSAVQLRFARVPKMIHLDSHKKLGGDINCSPRLSQFITSDYCGEQLKYEWDIGGVVELDHLGRTRQNEPHYRCLFAFSRALRRRTLKVN